MKAYKEHKSKKIDGVTYSTKNSKLIHSYSKTNKHPSAEWDKYLYKTKDGVYFVRYICDMYETIYVVDETTALSFINSTKSLF